MNMNDTQTGQSTPFKSPARINQCDQIISEMRQMLAKASAKATEQKRINRPFMSHGLTNQKVRNAGGTQQIWRDMNARHQDTTYQTLAFSMPMQSQLQAGV